MDLMHHCSRVSFGFKFMLSLLYFWDFRVLFGFYYVYGLVCTAGLYGLYSVN